MYKMIEPEAHELHSERINSLLGLLKIYQNFYLDPEAQDRATFVIAEDDKRSVYGGAVLYPCKPFKVPPFLELLPEDINNETLDKMCSSLQPKAKEYWTARICLCLGHDNSTSLRETVELYRCFYRHLYKAFCYFGEKENIDYLAFTLRAADTHVDNNLRILTYQTWPSLLEVKQSDNGSHRYLHGMLSLKKDTSKKRTFKENVLKPDQYSQKINLYSVNQINSPVKNPSSNEWRAS